MRIRSTAPLLMLELCAALGVASAFLGGSSAPALHRAPSRTRAVWACALSAADEERRRLEIQRLEACMRVARLEGAAEKAEAEGNLLGAIEAYEELLSLQPPTSPALREEDAARRALQQLLLESARREVEACGEEGCLTEGPAWESPPSEFIETELRRAPQFISGELRRAQ